MIDSSVGAETKPNRADVGVVVVAAGRGLRAAAAGGDVAKQYRSLLGKPVLVRAVAPFAAHPRVSTIVIVVGSGEDEERAATLLPEDPKLRFVRGAETRQGSVRAGLEAIRQSAPTIVLIHDAARPLVAPSTIDRVIDAVEPGIAVLPAIAVSDTLKRSGNGFVDATIARDGVFAAQTPQGFGYEAIREAHARAADAGRHDFTDDTAVFEWCGHRTKLVEGSPDNLKLTLPVDFERAEAILKGRRSMVDVRTGNGYDVHQLVDGDHVTLCGVRIAHDRGLSGHSDADVGLHALTDALLATCAEGDIGTHFPPSEDRWRGAASHIFVRHAVGIVRDAGGTICNVDVTLIAEAPKILPYRDAMRDAMAEMTGLDRHRVSVKATTNETIGFVGRREGIAAIATASVSYGND